MNATIDVENERAVFEAEATKHGVRSEDGFKLCWRGDGLPAMPELQLPWLFWLAAVNKERAARPKPAFDRTQEPDWMDEKASTDGLPPLPPLDPYASVMDECREHFAKAPDADGDER